MQIRAASSVLVALRKPPGRRPNRLARGASSPGGLRVVSAMPSRRSREKLRRDRQHDRALRVRHRRQGRLRGCTRSSARRNARSSSREVAGRGTAEVAPSRVADPATARGGSRRSGVRVRDANSDRGVRTVALAPPSLPRCFGNTAGSPATEDGAAMEFIRALACEPREVISPDRVMPPSEGIGKLPRCRLREGSSCCSRVSSLRSPSPRRRRPRR